MGTRLVVAGCLIFGVVNIAPAQETPRPSCELELQDGRGALIGSVFDAETKLPLQRADVVVEWQEGGRRRRDEQETDRNGHFRSCDLPAGVLLNVDATFGGRDARNVRPTLASREAQQVALSIDAPRSGVAGQVLDAGSGRGIAGAVVRVDGSSAQAVTAQDGTFRLDDLPAGTYRLHTEHVGYTNREDSLAIEYGANMLYAIRLATDVIELPPIDVTVRSHVLERRGYYEREERGFGTFLTRQSWDALTPQYPSDILRGVAAVHVAQRRDGFGYMILDRSNCPFRYIVNGGRVGADFQIDDLPAEWIEALEIYKGPAQVPGEFSFPPSSERANCGVIVIWTRMR